MRQFLLAAFIAASAFALPACTTPSAPLIERGNVMEVSRRVTESYAAAWNANDMARFGALYAPDARHVTLQGQFLRGRSAIVAAHRANRPRYAAGVRMVTQLEGARAITDDAIVAVMRMEFVNDPTAAGGIQAVRMTLTLARRGDDWLIAQAQASEPD
ncbi:MAG: SgcJ/EcaC family oxidoreductase [Terricaulis sp.]